MDTHNFSTACDEPTPARVSIQSEIERLLAIMVALRTPVTGCPWDIEQTFESIAPYTLEEAQEVVEAIHCGDRQNLCEELGDLLLQVVFHARMAEEEGSFSFVDVVQAINSKMTRRHPHVFGDRKGVAREEVNQLWRQIKAQEKTARAEKRRLAGLPASPDSVLAGVLTTQPALSRALKLQVKAASVGFDWNNPKLVLAKLREEIDEIEEAIDYKQQADIHEEIGDLLFATANLARHLEGDPEVILQTANTKFERRFHEVEQKIAAVGQSMTTATLEQMEAAWQQVKSEEP